VVAGESEALVKKGIETVQKKLSGKEVTWGDFGDEAKKEAIKEGTVDVLKALLGK